MNENQSIVLEWLKSNLWSMSEAPILLFSRFGWRHFGSELPENVDRAYKAMSMKEELELLKVFAEWALVDIKWEEK